MKKRIIIGISGASGAIYGKRALELLQDTDIETHLVVSKAAELTMQSENIGSSKDIAALANVIHKVSDIGASIASGSFKTMGMIIAPCSVKTMGEIATGVTSSLMSRAADVCLKERRKLVLMVRETPLHYGHLTTMTHLTQMGAIINPPVPHFYSNLKDIDDMVTQSIARVLDLFDIDVQALRRYKD